MVTVLPCVFQKFSVGLLSSQLKITVIRSLAAEATIYCQKNIKYIK